jgi:tetratricopeptide (TPR) repeat protein
MTAPGAVTARDADRTGGRRWVVSLLLIAALALSIRLVYLAELRTTTMWWLLVGDGEQYDAWAQRIVAGDWWGSEVFYQTPLYPYFLAVVFKIAGYSLGAVRVIQAMFGAASCVLLATSGRQLFSARVGVIAGVLLAIYPEAIFFDGLIQKSSVDLLLMTAVLAVISTFVRGRRPGYLALTGLLLGAFALNRENALVLLPIVILWIVLHFRSEPVRRRLGWAALVIAGMGAVLLPVALRNQSISGEFLISTSQFGPNFYIGNGRNATGRYEPLLPDRGNAKLERADAQRLAEEASGRTLRPGEVSRYWLDRALAEIGDDPGRWLRLMGRKLLLVVNAGELVDSESMAEYATYSLVLRTFRWHSFGVLLCLAAAGAVLTRRRWRELGWVYAIVLSLLLSVVVFYVFSRYRFPVVPILALFAAAAVAELLRRPFDWRQWRLAAAAAAAVAIVAHVPLVPPATETHFSMALQLSKLGRHAEAIAWLERGVAIAPDDTELRVRLALLRLETGDGARAIAELTTATQASPGMAQAHAALGVALERTGRSAEALRSLDTALRLEPRLASARINYGIALWKVGRRDEAVEQYRRAVDLDPQSPSAQSNLALALHQTGHTAEAIIRYEQALALKTDHPSAHSNLGLLLADAGRLDEARTHLLAALESSPENSGIRANLGDVLLRMGRTGEAIEQYRQALATAPDSVEHVMMLLERLGEALIRTGRIDEAKAMLRRGIGLAQAAGREDLSAGMRQTLAKLGPG